jgi:probable rRNA maturation factor
MDPLIDVIIEDDRWSDLDNQAQAAGLATFEALGLPVAGFTLCVMGCDDARIMELNGDFRGKPKATNVLSWPSQERGAVRDGVMPDLPEPGPMDDPEHLGDIAISFDTCAAEATAAGKSMNDHVTHLIIHGILHLLGYDHIREADGDLMEALEVRILAGMGQPNPYA